MVGARKPQKSGFENMTKDEKRKYFSEQMARAKQTLEEKTKCGDEKGVKRTEEIIRNIEGMISRL